MQILVKRSLRLLGLVASLAASNAIYATEYRFTELGTLGGSSSFALDINNLGWVTGNAQLATGQPAPRLNGFVYGNTTLSGIGVLAGSNNFSRGYAINDRGVVVGESDNNSSRAFVYEDGQMRGLTRLAGDNDRGVAHDINNAGVIVGISSNGSASRPTRWVNGSAQDLGTLDGTTTSTGRARAINDNGLIAGTSRRDVGGTVSQATLWNWAEAGGQPYKLGSLQADSFSEAYGINSTGSVVGVAVNGNTPSGTEIRQAVLWTAHADHYHIESLGSLGLSFSEARDINAAGQVVGFATNISGSPQSAFLWQSGSMRSLNALYDTSATGFVFRTAEGINDRGDIVGWGTTADGLTRAYVLTAVPEPETWAMLGAGLLLMGLRIGRTRRVSGPATPTA